MESVSAIDTLEHGHDMAGDPPTSLEGQRRPEEQFEARAMPLGYNGIAELALPSGHSTRRTSSW